jgi:hypothetical protein
MPSAALQSADSFRKLWRDASVSVNILAADDYSASFLRLITCLPGYAIFIQKIQMSVNVETNAESTVQSSNATPVKFAEINNPSSEGPFFWDFGETGAQVVADEHLNFRNSAAGTALALTVQAYMKPIGPLVAKTAGATSGYNTL